MSRKPEGSLERTLLVLTFTAGLVDAVSFLGLGRVFTANMTGNLALLGFGFAGAAGLSIAAPLVSLGSFVLGATVGGRIGSRLKDRMRWLAAGVAVEASLVLLAALLAIGAEDPATGWRRFAMIALLATALGSRNAAVRGLKMPDLKTTVMTWTIAGLAAESPLGGKEGHNEAARFWGVVAILAGAFTGAALVLHTSLVVPLFLIASLNGGVFLAVRACFEESGG